MTELSVADLYELYMDIIGKCTTKGCSLSDEEIQYNLFEEFDVGAHSFLHDDSLAKLHDSGFIDSEMVKVSKDIRKRWLALQSRSWTVQEIKTRKEWKDLFALCDMLMSKTLRGSTEKGDANGKR